MNLFYHPDCQDSSVLSMEESKHLHVLRKKVGDEIRIVDGKGFFYDVVLTAFTKNQFEYAIKSTHQEAKRDYRIHLAIAPTKNIDRTEWLVEKCIEIGIDQITFVTCENSERTKLRIDRIEKIAISAMKQSLQATLPSIAQLDFKTFITKQSTNQKMIAYVDATNPDHIADVIKPASGYCILIGPEGDFTPEELSAAVNEGFAKVSLGKNRLRTETAGIVSCVVIHTQRAKSNTRK